MQAFTPLALLILGVVFVKGDYWWMNNEGAFGGNSEPQIIRESNGGYGGGKRQSQTVKGYPQKTKEYTQNEGGYQQNTGGYSEEYPQEYPNNGGYPQGNSNGVTISGDPSQKLQDNSGKKKQQQPPCLVCRWCVPNWSILCSSVPVSAAQSAWYSGESCKCEYNLHSTVDES